MGLEVCAVGNGDLACQGEWCLGGCIKGAGHLASDVEARQARVERSSEGASQVALSVRD